MTRSIMTSIKIQKQLHFMLQKRVIDEGYGMRGKSRWVMEAIHSFFDLNNYPEYVVIAEDMSVLDDVLSIRLSDSLMNRIDLAILEIRTQFPVLEGVKSNLIRASIIQRLLRS